MITRDAAFGSAGHMPGTSALRDIIRQSELSGARRCAAVLYTDRLPQALTRPHHVRLARQALDRLAGADKAQLFNLSRGRIAVVWRAGDGPELEVARRALDHLLSGQPALLSDGANALLRGYDLPQQAARLLDDVADFGPQEPCGSRAKIDLKLLAGLEATLARADLACFARARPIVVLREAGGSGAIGRPAWMERYFAIDELAAGLSPGRDLRADPWLFGRLTRTLDMRMLALLAAPGELMRCGPVAINVNVATILSPAFLRLDAALPSHLRGTIVLILRATDILADGTEFAFARDFAQVRGYRLALADVTPRLLGLLDLAAARIDLLHVALTPALRQAEDLWRRSVPPGSDIILTDIARPSELRWAIEHGFGLGCGTLFKAASAHGAPACR